jgi:hypothetical protein
MAYHGPPPVIPTAAELNLMKQEMYAQNYFNQHVTQTTGNITLQNGTAKQDFGFNTAKDDKVDWSKFAMWLRGFLAAIEGQSLSPESVGKIMDKLATVDPDKKLSYQPDVLDWMKNIPQYVPPPPQISPWVVPNTAGTSLPPQSQQLQDIQWKIYCESLSNDIANLNSPNIKSKLNTIKYAAAV